MICTSETSDGVIYDREASTGLRESWRWWLPPALISLALALLYIDPFIGDWDALDYTLISIEGRPSSMALGRTLFIFMNHAAWRVGHELFGLQAENAYLLFKYMVVVQAPFAVVACWALAREVCGSVHTATIAALLVATSPFFVIYSGQVMTEIPSVLLLALALVAYLRGVKQRRLWIMLLGALLLGAGVNVREPVMFFAPWLILAPLACGWKLERRAVARVALSVLVFIVVAFGPFAFWFFSDIGGYRAAWYGWRESGRLEAARHPFTARNALAFLVYFFLAAPLILVALPIAALREWVAKRFSAPLALTIVGLMATLCLLFYYSTTINWRYFLTGLPAVAPIVAAYFLHSQTIKMGTVRRGFLSVIAGVALIAIVLGIFLKPSRDKFTAQHKAMKDYRARLAAVPLDGVMIAGAQSIAVTYWRGIGLGQWEVIGAGSGWPGRELATTIEKYLADDRRVFLDTDPRFWPACGWQATETRELVAIEQHFRFQKLSDTIYEILPLSADAPLDHLNLKGLLPENRPTDIEKCAGQGKMQG